MTVNLISLIKLNAVYIFTMSIHLALSVTASGSLAVALLYTKFLIPAFCWKILVEIQVEIEGQDFTVNCLLRTPVVEGCTLLSDYQI